MPSCGPARARLLPLAKLVVCPVCAVALIAPTDRIADAALKRALLPEHDALLIFMLKQRDPNRFNRKMIDMQVSGDVNNPVTVTIDHQHTVGRPRVMILPDNNRPALTEAEIQTERAAVERENMIGSGVLLEAEAEADE